MLCPSMKALSACLALLTGVLAAAPLVHEPNETIVFVGNGLGSRMMQHG